MGLDITFSLVDRSVVELVLQEVDTAVFEGEPERIRKFVKRVPPEALCTLVKHHRGYLEDPIHAIVMEEFGFHERGVGWVMELSDLSALSKAIRTEVAQDPLFDRFDKTRTVNYLTDLIDIVDSMDDKNQFVLYSWC